MYVRPLNMGDRYGRLVIIGTAEPFVAKSHRVARYVLQCDCGGIRVARQDVIRRGDCNSCGCLQIKYGHSANGSVSGTYGSWAAMMERCHNPKNKNYRAYGAKGVTVYGKWQTFAGFLEDMGEKPDGWSIDRIDPFGDYEPSNCQWLPAEVNSRKHRYHRLNVELASTLKSRFLLGQNQADMAREFDLSQALVSSVCTGKNWAYVRPSDEFYNVAPHKEGR